RATGLELPSPLWRLRLRNCQRLDWEGILGLLRLSRGPVPGPAGFSRAAELSRQPGHTVNAVRILDQLKIAGRFLRRKYGKREDFSWERATRSFRNGNHAGSNGAGRA